MNGLMQPAIQAITGPTAKQLGKAVLSTVVAVHVIRAMDKTGEKISDWRKAKKAAKAEAKAAKAEAKAKAKAEAAEAEESAAVYAQANEMKENFQEPLFTVGLNEQALDLMNAASINDLRKKAASLGINTAGKAKAELADLIVRSLSVEGQMRNQG